MIEDDVFKEMVGGNPRLLAMCQWRLALGALIFTTEDVSQAFLEDWNQIDELYKRFKNSPGKGLGKK